MKYIGIKPELANAIKFTVVAIFLWGVPLSILSHFKIIDGIAYVAAIVFVSSVIASGYFYMRIQCSHKDAKYLTFKEVAYYSFFAPIKLLQGDIPKDIDQQ